MIIFNLKFASFYYVATRDSSSRKLKVLCSTYAQYSLRIYESDVTEWLPGWPENLKQAVKYEGYIRRKSVY